MNPIYNEDRPFPIDVNNLVQDTLETIRPKTKMFKDYDEAIIAIEELEKEVKPKIGNFVLKMIQLPGADPGFQVRGGGGATTLTFLGYFV